MVPAGGIEPHISPSTAERSTVELSRVAFLSVVKPSHIPVMFVFLNHKEVYGFAVDSP